MTESAATIERAYPRARDRTDIIRLVPIHVVWEITLACNLKCMHCGSRAGHVRNDELTTAECLSLVDQMAALGTREVTLIGGEAYLRRDWIEILRRITGHGMLCLIQTGARHLTDARLNVRIPTMPPGYSNPSPRIVLI
jgi:MoaA/NifB/PqqE/SkfB family radical SAM enzyme